MATIRSLMIRLGIEQDSGAEANLGKFEKRIAKLGAVIGSVFAVGKIIDFGKQAFAEAQEAQKVGALTAQVIKTTGGAAKITADQIGDLATAISNKTGIDDEAIQSGENLLLTFTRIRNETGKGNDIFNQATGIITDMSKALGTDMKSSAIQVGKALNDPLKGITALTRVGVTFDATQKKQIAGFMKSGDVMSAQKVILAELQKEFGGAATAMATPADKAAVAWGNFKESVGTLLLPILNRLFTTFTTNIVPALQKALVWMQNNTDTVKRLAMVLGGLIAAYYAAKSATTIFNAAQTITRGLMLGINATVIVSRGVWAGFVAVQNLATRASLGTRIQLGLLAVQQKIAAGATVIATAATKGATVASKIFAVGLRLVGLAVRFAMGPIGLIVTAIGLLIAIVVVAYKKNETFRKIVDAVWKFIKKAVKIAIDLIVGYFKFLIDFYVHKIPNAVRFLWDKIKQIWGSIVQIIKTVISTIKGHLNFLIDLVLHKIPNAFKNGVSAVGRFWNNLKEIAKKPVSFVVNTIYNKGIARIWNWVAEKVHLPTLPYITGFRTGGPIKQGTTKTADDVLIRASRGEFMINADATRKNLGLIDYINEHGRGTNVFEQMSKAGFGDPGIPGFQEGGIIGWVKSFGRKAKDFFISGLIKAGKAVLNPIVGLTRRTIGGTPFGAMLSSVIESLAGGLLDRFKPLESEVGGPGRRAVALARTQIGVPYVWGGTAWGRGLDCSGLTQGAWQRAVGHGGMPRTTWTQKPWLTRVSKAIPGDIGQPHPGHTYMYAGNNRIIEAPRTGLNVREVPVRPTPFWGRPPASWMRMDSGGVLKPGYTGVFNGTGSPEYAFTRRQLQSVGAGISIGHMEIHAEGGDPRKVEKAVYEGLKKYKSRNGKSLKV